MGCGGVARSLFFWEDFRGEGLGVWYRRGVFGMCLGVVGFGRVWYVFVVGVLGRRGMWYMGYLCGGRAVIFLSV